MQGYIIYMVNHGIRVRVVGFTTLELAQDFYDRWKDSPKINGKLELIVE